MKTLSLKPLFILLLSIFIFGCGGHKSQTVVIIHSTTKMFAIGDPPVVFKSYGAFLNYFSPGTIVAFRVNHEVLKQPGLSGKVYWIDKNLKLNEIGTIDTAVSNREIAEKYLVSKELLGDDMFMDEIDLKDYK